MQIDRVETIALTDMDVEEVGWVSDVSEDYRQLLFVRLHGPDGTVGLGETYPRPQVDAEVIHEHIAPRLLETESISIEGSWQDIHRHANYFGGYGGAEMRALSAVDIALWDLKGKSLGVPIYELLGGPRRDEVRTYNTCYEDEYDFMSEPVALAEDLLDDGIDAMKVWPFDDIGYANDGSHVSLSEMERGAEPIESIREAVGSRMEIAVEFHGLWDVAAAKRIARHLEPYDPMWLEELLEVGDVSAYAEVARTTDLPLSVSERLMTKHDFNQLIDAVDLDVAMFDVEWVGGLTEAKKVAALAEANHLPVAPHNCGGPVLHFASLQLAASLPNLMVLESVRGRYDGWHRPLVTEPATAEDGQLVVPDGPGIGTSLHPSVLKSETVTRRVTER